jgi:serine/threonine-protein kinase
MAEDRLKPGSKLGPYTLDSVIGEGGMGTVFRAVHRDATEPVALKVVREVLTRDETYRRRLAHEARAAGEVQHHGLVPVLDVGEADGRSYIASAYVDGPSLDHRIEEDGPLTVEEAVGVVSDVASGLDALHDAGIVHRDVKPSNILLDPAGTALLTDFGLARGRAYTVLTRPGRVMGTLDYIAPELVRGEPASAASDLYALGCVAFECLAGSPPFADRPAMEVASAHLHDEPPDPCRGRTDCAERFGWTVVRALEKEPRKRPGSGTAYAGMLRLAAGMPRA